MTLAFPALASNLESSPALSKDPELLMNGPNAFGLRALTLAGVAAAALLPAGLAAQDGADFLFRRPFVSLTVRGGYAVPRAGSDIFDFTREHLMTLDQEDISFSGPAVQGELAVRVTEQIDIAAGVGYSKRTAHSEFRDFEGTDDLPIRQTTTFSRTPLTLSVKGYLMPRGRSLSRFAWVPARWSPYLSAGAGAVRYVFDQQGEFIDFDTADLEIFEDRFRSEGWAPTAHAAVGVDLSLNRFLVATAEGRYSLGSAELGPSWEGFDKIDLSGFQGTVGVSLRF
jgi:hypothetical protein